MLTGLIAKKIEMSQIFDEEKGIIPVTLLQVGPCIVIQIKTQDKDGYFSAQIGFGTAKKINKPMQAHLKKSGAQSAVLREVRAEELGGLKLGQEVKVSDVFEVGEKVTVTGVSKGKGFAGVVKRHSFSGGPKSHGQVDRLRAPGSIGAQGLGRVLKGTKMAGRMGQRKVTVKGLEVIEIDAGRNLMKLKGAIPGSIGSIILIRKS